MVKLRERNFRGAACPLLSAVWDLLLLGDLLLPVFVIQENLLENEIEQNGKAEYMMLHDKIESQLPGCVNNMDKDEAEKK